MMGMRCVIVGGSGGIGAALVRNLAAREDVEAVYATARDMDAVPNIGDVVAVPLDLGDEDSIAAAAEHITGDGPLDLVIVATGLLQPVGQGTGLETDALVAPEIHDIEPLR